MIALLTSCSVHIVLAVFQSICFGLVMFSSVLLAQAVLLPGKWVLNRRLALSISPSVYPPSGFLRLRCLHTLLLAYALYSLEASFVASISLQKFW